METGQVGISAHFMIGYIIVLQYEKHFSKQGSSFGIEIDVQRS